MSCTELTLYLQKYKAESKAPLLINSCEVDTQFPKESQAVADEILGEGKFAPGYVRNYYDGCTHGFAVRGDLVRLPSLCERRFFLTAECRATRRSRQARRVRSRRPLSSSSSTCELGERL